MSDELDQDETSGWPVNSPPPGRRYPVVRGDEETRYSLQRGWPEPPEPDSMSVEDETRRRARERAALDAASPALPTPSLVASRVERTKGGELFRHPAPGAAAPGTELPAQKAPLPRPVTTPPETARYTPFRWPEPSPAPRAGGPPQSAAVPPAVPVPLSQRLPSVAAPAATVIALPPRGDRVEITDSMIAPDGLGPEIGRPAPAASPASPTPREDRPPRAPANIPPANRGIISGPMPAGPDDVDRPLPPRPQIHARERGDIQPDDFGAIVENRDGRRGRIYQIGKGAVAVRGEDGKAFGIVRGDARVVGTSPSPAPAPAPAPPVDDPPLIEQEYPYPKDLKPVVPSTLTPQVAPSRAAVPDSPLAQSGAASAAESTLFGAAGIADAVEHATRPFALKGLPYREEDQARYFDLRRQWLEIQQERARRPARPGQLDPRQASLLAQMHELEQPPRAERASGLLAEAAQGTYDYYSKNPIFGVIPAAPVDPHSNNLAAQIGRGGGKALALAPTMMAGPASLPLTTVMTGAESYERGYTETENQLRASGLTDEDEIRARAEANATKVALKTVPAMAAYMVGGKLTASTIARLMPAAAPALAKVAAGTAGAIASNVVTGSALRAVEGGDSIPTFETLTTDTLLGILHGTQAGLGPKARAARELQRREQEARETKTRSGATLYWKTLADEQDAYRKSVADPANAVQLFTRPNGMIVLSADDLIANSPAMKAARDMADPNESFKAGQKIHKALEPDAQTVREEAFQYLLRKPGEGKVVFMVGGPGSGKSRYIKGKNDAEFIVDSVHSKAEVLSARIQLALDTGRFVEVPFILRDVGDSMDGNVKRAIVEKRMATAKGLAQSHVEARNAFLEVRKKFEGNRKVKFEVLDSTTLQPLELPSLSTEEAQQLSNKALDEIARGTRRGWEGTSVPKAIIGRGRGDRK